VVGSITHCEGYQAAAVARRIDAVSVGIDAEPNEVLPARVLPSVASEEERGRLLALPGGGVCWDRVLFSAKETVFKAWYPIALRWLGFHDVRLVIRPDDTNPARGTFAAELLGLALDVDGHAVTSLDGRYCVEHGRVLTAIVVGAAAAPGRGARGPASSPR
jgi:4'-phosphopantetheinyl transferase EntD